MELAVICRRWNGVRVGSIGACSGLPWRQSGHVHRRDDRGPQRRIGFPAGRLPRLLWRHRKLRHQPLCRQNGDPQPRNSSVRQGTDHGTVRRVGAGFVRLERVRRHATRSHDHGRGRVRRPCRQCSLLRIAPHVPVGRQQYAIRVAVLAERSDRQLRSGGVGNRCCADWLRLAGCARRRSNGRSCSSRGCRCHYAGPRRACRSTRMRRQGAWLLPVVIAAAAFGQEPQATIRVEVTAASEPVEGAEVTVNGKSVRTGQDGAATSVAPPGEVKVSVTKEGYFPATASLLAGTVRESVLRVELEPRKTVEEEIKVYATRNDVRIQDSPLHVDVLQREEVEEKMLMTPGDIVMMLNEMGGMRVQTTSPSLGAASVRVQGMRGRYTSFLSDGLPLFGQQGAGLGLLQIPPMDLGQVEVIKGNASALYGSAAMAGVVNLISRRPENKPVHEFLFNESSLGETDASAFLASQLTPHWGASLLGGGYGQEHRDVDHDGWAAVADYGRGVLRPRFYWDNQHGGTALLTGGVIYEDRTGGTVPGAVLPETGQPYVEALKTRRYDLGGNVQWVLGGRYVVTGRFSASDQEHRQQFGEDIERDRHDLLFGEVSIRGTSGKHSWVAGAADQWDAFRPSDTPQFGYTYHVSGLFAQDDITLAPWVSVSASARLDFHNRY